MGYGQPLFDPDVWRDLGVHWHCYVEVDSGGEFACRSKRADRLRRRPGVVLDDPVLVAEWIASRQREYSARLAVRLIGPGGGTGHLADDVHLDHDRCANLEVLSCGDSVYATIPGRGEVFRVRLFAEAVTAEECRGLTHLLE